MSPRQLIINLLDRLARTDAYADLLLENAFKTFKLSEQDKTLVQEIFFGVIRWHLRLNWIAKQLYQGPWERTPRFIRQILQISLYQLIYMDKIPVYATINEAVALAKLKGSDYWGKKINAILRTFQREQHKIKWPDYSAQPVQYIAVQYSHPDWLVDRWIKRWSMEETIALCKANNLTPSLTLRVNHLKTSTEQLGELLLKYDIQTSPVPFSNHFLNTKRLPDLSRFKPFQEGLFSIQDASAGLACQLLTPQPGDKIIDLCAAPGGKTTYLAELSNDNAHIFAIDRNKSRLKLIKQNLYRLGLHSIHLIQTDGTQFSCHHVDKVIVDAPCSGTGVLSKRVDLRWKRMPEQIQELSQLQLRLINNAAQLLKSGGVLVYCTCTIEPEENERIIEKFLLQNNDFHLESAANYVSEPVTDAAGFIYTFPHRHGIDGSFATRLVKA